MFGQSKHTCFINKSILSINLDLMNFFARIINIDILLCFEISGKSCSKITQSFLCNSEVQFKFIKKKRLHNCFKNEFCFI